MELYKFFRVDGDGHVIPAPDIAGLWKQAPFNIQFIQHHSKVFEKRFVLMGKEAGEEEGGSFHVRFHLLAL